MKSAAIISAKNLMKLTRFEKILLLLDFAKESVQKFWQKIYGSKILKASACLSVLLITLVIVFSHKPYAQSLPNCSDLPDGTAPKAGENCLYFGLPLCSSIVAPNTPQHRSNCADLIDLPLCSQIVTGGAIVAKPGKNCVGLCSDSAYNSTDPEGHPEWVRSIDYAIFNRDCIRFCDDIEVGVVKQPGVINCSERKCHQLLDGVTPVTGTNCNILPCNLLTPDELNKSKFDDETKKYCEGSDLKCYKFTQSQLPYMRLRGVNPTCLVHNCKVENAACGPNDVLNITSRGTDYAAVYSRFIYNNMDVENSTAYCKRIECKPVIQSQYRCTARTADGSTNVHSVGTIEGENAIMGDSNDIYRNPKCDDSGPGSLCGTLVLGANPSLDTLNPRTNYCYKTIDCNLAVNDKATECLLASNTGSDDSANIDPFDSWFYRPKPPTKATNDRGVILPMNSDLCYTESQMRDQNWGTKVWLFGWYWFQSSFKDLRSPGACDTNRDGARGKGYPYLCGTSGSLYSSPASDAVYFKGYATTDFSGTTPKHKVTVCTRFKNTLSLDTCGARECGINEWFSHITSQACGADVCKELIIDDANEAECIMSHNDGMDGACAATVDSYLRVRAVKYNNKICAFLDSKGQLAYNGMFMDGTETISFSDADQINPGTVCANDPTSNATAGCAGHDSNSEEGYADRWRALMRVAYVENNRPEGNTAAEYKGYLDRDGKFYKEQACPKVTMRVPPPDLYIIGNMANSEKLFVPPVNIKSASKIRGGDDAVVPSGQVYGKTDFHYPEIKVQFGDKTYRMSLGFGYTGYEDDGEEYEASPSSLTVSTVFNGKTYDASLFVKKEFFDNIGIPQFCLYRKLQDQNGLSVEPLRVACVERNIPDINNAINRQIDPSLPVRKTVIYPKGSNQYNDAKINIRYLDGGTNKLDNNCTGDDKCSPEISLANVDYKKVTCVQDVESHRLCVKREECSAIYIECMQNEVDLNNANNRNEDLNRFLSMRKYCNENLVPSCNRKKGVSANGGNIYTPLPPDVAVDTKAYGWFNELCIVSGFQTKLKLVIAHNTETGVMGKCIISPSSPSKDCPDGGRAPNCLCAEAPQGFISDVDYTARLQTPREAGLCIDMPLPPFCPIIDYNKNPNTDIADSEYVNNSLGKSSYSTASVAGVHLTHKARTEGVNSGYAEFPQALPGMQDVRGECKGFWTSDKNSSGIALFPLRTCVNNNGNAVWNANVQNQCIRFSCPSIFTVGPDATGVYQAGYGALETGEAKGTSNGFAMWDKYTKVGDFVETRSANSCIPGFRPKNSSPVIKSGLITGYSYNISDLPSRKCDQLGNWGAPTNVCTRIYCGAINIAKPKSSNDAALWAKWYNNGGASFVSVPASRSTSRTQTESISTGVCDNSLGFYVSPGGANPTLECDYLGNWGVVKNPCTTSCDAITDNLQASSGNNGFSKWDKVTAALTSGGIEGVFKGCVEGYIPNPYPPALDIDGRPLDSSVANDLSRRPENPKRKCQVGSSVAGATAGVWGATINGCINQCPGADVDSRIGVGVTTHRLSNGTSIEARWASTELGQYAYITNWAGEESMLNASYFNGSTRITGTYLLRRLCNRATGKWDEPTAMCSANGGEVSKATYFIDSLAAGYANSIVAGDSSQSVSGKCLPEYWFHNRGSATEAPIRQCLFADNEKYIDKVYLELASGKHNCERKKCPDYTGFIGFRGAIKPTSPSSEDDPTFLSGGKIFGRCLNNEKNKSGSVVYTTLLSGSNSPSVTCQDNGAGSLVWTTPNEDVCKYGCDIGDGTGELNDHGGDGGVDYGFHAFNMAHGEAIVVVVTDKAGEGCTQHFWTMSCIDGNGLRHIARLTENTDLCHNATYVPETRGVYFYNSWGGGEDYRGASYSNGGKYKNKYGKDSIFGIAWWD